MPACIDLREFSDRYRRALDPASDARSAKLADPWEIVLPCRYGTIYPEGGDRLALEIDRHKPTVLTLLDIPGVVLQRDGDERTLVFPLSAFDAVAEVVQPKRRRKLTDAQRAILDAGRRLSEPYRFRPAAG